MKAKFLNIDAWAATLASVTFATTCVAFALLRGAGFLKLSGTAPSASELNLIGGFLGGIFAPLALLWAARSFFLQRQQLIATMSAMTEQAELLRAANANQIAQLATLEHHRAEDKRANEDQTAPRLSLRSITNEWSEEKKATRFATEIINVGSLALGYRIRIYTKALVDGKAITVFTYETAVPLRPDESIEIDVYLKIASEPELRRNGFTCEVVSMRTDQRTALQTFSTNDLLNYFEPETFEPVSKTHSFRLPPFSRRGAGGR
ncbi:hypothetical protein FIV34_01840 [Luteibacter pinisoli]|uniref:Uncharacterized protein n=1 Tax=Luteibacter pinisoli TaxID=2589080 RepID=A0A4Y5Z0P0_9GAMM|nr:hypothetical protein [Luteibacter pinisoli]QDE38023.1 hypothetical protein FIV34_01840 [Luteibacter pinisoli]